MKIDYKLIEKIMAYRNKLKTLNADYDRQYLLELFDEYFKEIIYGK